MIQDFAKAWDANKRYLQTYFETHRMAEYNEYKVLVQLLFDLVINPWLATNGKTRVNTKDIHEINNGEIQGCTIFALHTSKYSPNEYDYIFTHQNYGTCAGCDTLMKIQHYSEDLPTKEQVGMHMTLCLHLLQRCVMPFDYETSGNRPTFCDEKRIRK